LCFPAALLYLGDTGQHMVNPMVLVIYQQADAGKLHTKDEGAVQMRSLCEIFDLLDE
jgi:hypothetical protein